MRTGFLREDRCPCCGYPNCGHSHDAPLNDYEIESILASDCYLFSKAQQRRAMAELVLMRERAKRKPIRRAAKKRKAKP